MKTREEWVRNDSPRFSFSVSDRDNKNKIERWNRKWRNDEEKWKRKFELEKKEKERWEEFWIAFSVCVILLVVLPFLLTYPHNSERKKTGEISTKMKEYCSGSTVSKRHGKLKWQSNCLFFLSQGNGKSMQMNAQFWLPDPFLFPTQFVRLFKYRFEKGCVSWMHATVSFSLPFSDSHLRHWINLFPVRENNNLDLGREGTEVRKEETGNCHSNLFSISRLWLTQSVA